MRKHTNHKRTKRQAYKGTLSFLNPKEKLFGNYKKEKRSKSYSFI